MLCGIHVDDENLKTLVDLLLRVSRADNLPAAATIEAGLAEEWRYYSALSLGVREARGGVAGNATPQGR